MGLDRLLNRWGAQPKFSTNAMSSSASCCSPTVQRNTRDVDRNFARLGGFFLVTSTLCVNVISVSSLMEFLSRA